MSKIIAEIDEHAVYFPQRNGDQKHLGVVSFCGPEILGNVASRRCINLILRQSSYEYPSRVDLTIDQIRLTEQQAMQLCRAIVNAYRPDVKRGLAGADVEETSEIPENGLDRM